MALEKCMDVATRTVAQVEKVCRILKSGMNHLEESRWSNRGDRVEA